MLPAGCLIAQIAFFAVTDRQPSFTVPVYSISSGSPTGNASVGPTSTQEVSRRLSAGELTYPIKGTPKLIPIAPAIAVITHPKKLRREPFGDESLGEETLSWSKGIFGDVIAAVSFLFGQLSRFSWSYASHANHPIPQRYVCC
jgi:hypothetical protein